MKALKFNKVNKVTWILLEFILKIYDFKVL